MFFFLNLELAFISSSHVPNIFSIAQSNVVDNNYNSYNKSLQGLTILDSSKRYIKVDV